MKTLVNLEKLYRIIGMLEGLTWCADEKLAEALDIAASELLKLVEEE